MRIPRGVGAALALGLFALPVALPVAASAQPADKAIDVQTFEYAIGPKSFLSVNDADVGARGQLAIDVLVTFMTAPFKIYNINNETGEIEDTRTTVVETVTAAQLTAAYGVSDRLQVGANLPLIFAMTGEGLMASTGRADPDGLSVSGLGDLVLEGKLRLVRKRAFAVGGIGQVSMPTSVGSNESQFIGDNLPTLRAKLALQYDGGRLALGATTGVILRKPRTIYDSTIGQQLTWGVAAAFRITDRFSLIGESFGRAGLPDFSLDASPLEAIGGLRLYASPALAIVVGGGAGLVKGIGSPESRFFLSIGYSPDVRDTDRDGIPNARDKCILVAEDRDGHEDEDGCPDDDNDGDRRPDAEDKCPDTAEDLDGFDDDDGCPELDNDGDKFADLVDKCPNEPEDGKDPQPTDGCPADKRDADGDGLNDLVDQCPTQEEDLDGFEDGDGCPEADNDGDGIADADDQCPLCAEDKDGFEDGDGCPELDNDRDGIPDAQDKCPLQAEVINGVKDDDGCPDTGGLAVVTLDGDRLLIARVPTLKHDRSSELSPGGLLIADQLAMFVMQQHEVTKWLVAVAQPKADTAKQLADAIKARLLARGVPAGRVEVASAVGPAKINGVVQERGDAPALTCPTGSEVKQRPGTIPATPKPLVSPPAVPPKTPPAAPAGDDIEIE
ncbi:MAG: thrombospondin type 3 repeat-containing protein [Myxococcota bacterium]|nr:thrombospondin type 3 repeat-containing protein [Myxococcota bacterium]